MLQNFTAGLMFKAILFVMQNNNTVEENPSQLQPLRDTDRCYGVYGCFSVIGPWINENRPIAYFPFPPDVLNVKYPTFTRRNTKIPFFLDTNDPDKNLKAGLSPKGPFFFISHGYLEGGNKLWVQEMMEAILTLEEHADATVVNIDWRGGSSPPYTQAVANIRLIGVITAHLIHDLFIQLNLKNLDNFHFIGHSLGAHLGGYTGDTLKKVFGLTLGRITGMDPAEPHFGKGDDIIKLDRSDAHFVDVIHSDASQFITGGLGISELIGHVDFFPNGGAVQPGCNQGMMQYIATNGAIFNGFRKFLNCNHVRSHEFFVESILSPCPFMTAECPSYQDFLKGACMKCGTPGNQCIPFGFHSYAKYKELLKKKAVSEDKSVRAFFMTSDSYPFCRMHYRVTVNISASMESSQHGGDVGRLWMTLVDKNGVKSDRIPLEDHAGHHKPGTQRTLVVSVKEVGISDSAIIEWEYETNLLNPLTWRILMSPRVYVSWIHIESMEYKTRITVCPQNGDPLIANLPSHFQRGYCSNLSTIKISTVSTYRFLK